MKWKTPVKSLSTESKKIEYEIILVHKYKVQQTEVISNLYSLFYSQITRTFGQIEHLHFPNTFSYFLHSYDITSLGNIYPITFWKYTKHQIKVSLQIFNMLFKEYVKNMQPFYEAFVKLL